MPRHGWKLNGKKADGSNNWEPVDDEPRAPAPAVDAPERTTEEMLGEVLRLANRQLAGLTKLAQGSMLSDEDLGQLGAVQRLILGHVRINPGVDPMEQKPGETDTDYIERLERMKQGAK